MADADLRHLDEDTMVLLTQGALSGQALERAEQHLLHCDDCRILLAESLQDAEHALSNPEATHALETIAEGELDVPAVGSVLVEKYRVESVIGQGGMGVVLSATHLVLGNGVAIKVLRRPGPNEVARFLREARVSAQIRNRHIARVFDFGQLPSGAPFLVMELLEGRDLARCIESGPLPVMVAVDYVTQACEALAEVHTLGIVHRDLKPANLFLAEDHGQSIVKVLDFGILKSIGGALEMASTQLTGQHAVIGSPVYMSPEQLRSGQVDARSDVWALGVILYELMTAQLPFGARTLSALAMAIASEDPTPPSKLRPEITRELEQVILRCLRKRPEDRYADASALRSALLALPRRPSRSWLPFSAVAVMLAGGGWWLFGQRAPETSARAPAMSARAPETAPIESASAPPPLEPAPPARQPVVDAAVALDQSEPAPLPKKTRRRTSPTVARRSIGPTDTPD